jgi:CRISPR-associated endonuclease Csy4
MKLYHEITIIENSEISCNFIWEKLYTQIHLALVGVQNTEFIVPVGVSFPEYRLANESQPKDIGSKLRLFGQDEETLSKLNITKFLLKLQDYVHISSVRDIPNKITTFATYTRKQSDKRIESLARRKVKRENIDYEQALHKLGDYKQTKHKLPFITINSLSSNKRFPIFIEKNTMPQENSKGFNSYGFSAVSTVPDF